MVIIGSGNGLSPVRWQAITWTNADLLLMERLGRNFGEILIKSLIFSQEKCFRKCHLQNGDHFVLASIVKLTTFSNAFPWKKV